MKDSVLDAPYTDWSALPGRVPPVEAPFMTNSCTLSPMQCDVACNTNRCIVPAQQPVVPVPVYQEIHRKNRIVEIPQAVVTDKILPKVFNQDVTYDVPKVSIQYREKVVRVPRIEYRQKIVEVPVPVGYRYNVVSKWNIREVPKVIPKYVGPQKDLHVEIPQLKFIDKTIHKEIPVYVGEKLVPKQIIEEDPVEVFEYRYVEKVEDVPVYKYKPVFDVEVDIPPPLIVPVPVQPKEIELKPERLSVQEWKKRMMGGTTSFCNNGEICGADSQNFLSCGKQNDNACMKPCQPGGIFSPTGLCGKATKKVCCCKNKTCPLCKRKKPNHLELITPPFPKS